MTNYRVISGHVNVSEQLITRRSDYFDQMFLDELSGRPWTKTVARRRQTAQERIDQIREAIARKIAPWAMYHEGDY